MDEFLNRLNAQKEVLRLVNSKAWPIEQLISLNEKAILRWKNSNKISDDSRCFQLVMKASELLFTLATRSQEQISEDYQGSEDAFRELIANLRNEM